MRRSSATICKAADCGKTERIRQITDAHSAILSDRTASSGTTAVPIVTMNEIEISGENLALTTLEVDYTPRVR